jgi:hypothetical protein
MIDRLPAALAMLLFLPACEASPPASADRCAVSRLVAHASRMAPGLLPPDDAPRPSVLPTPVLSDGEAAATGDCMRPGLESRAAASDVPAMRPAAPWHRFSTQFFRSEHGRYLEVWGNPLAADYARRWEDSIPLPVGAIVKKHGFTVLQSGETVYGPQFTMEKLPAGAAPQANDWRFALIDGSGATIGETGGRNSDAVAFCIACHRSAWRQDFLFFVPPPYRPRS